MKFFKPSGVFPVDKWPNNTSPIEGVTRQAFYAYKVSREVRTAVMTFSDEGDANNLAQPPDRVIVELAVLKEDDFERQLASMIASVTENLEPEPLDLDGLYRKLSEPGEMKSTSATHALFCHPSVPEAFLKPLEPLGLPIVQHSSLPVGGQDDAVILGCQRLPGLVVHAEDGAGAFIFPDLFFKIRVTLSTKSAWDRLLRDNLID